MRIAKLLLICLVAGAMFGCGGLSRVVPVAENKYEITVDSGQDLEHFITGVGGDGTTCGYARYKFDKIVTNTCPNGHDILNISSEGGLVGGPRLCVYHGTVKCWDASGSEAVK